MEETMGGFSRYAVDSSKIVSEIIDGEAILINLDNGCYYSLNQAGAEIWTLLQAGATLPEIVTELAARYDGAGVDLEASTQQLIDVLCEEQLIRPKAAHLPQDGGPTTPTSGGAEPKGRFTPPALQKFTDMQGFLLVDPIHEVDETGWPNAPAPGDEESS
jgi:Coenzyme PQQ synthesis protein D (PqqD)